MAAIPAYRIAMSALPQFREASHFFEDWLFFWGVSGLVGLGFFLSGSVRLLIGAAMPLLAGIGTMIVLQIVSPKQDSRGVGLALLTSVIGFTVLANLELSVLLLQFHVQDPVFPLFVSSIMSSLFTGFVLWRLFLNKDEQGIRPKTGLTAGSSGRQETGAADPER